MTLLEGSPLGRGRRATGWSLAVVGVVALTAVLVPHRDGPTPTYQSMLYLSVVVACSLVGGRGPALGASALGFLALNFYFTAPLHTLDVTSRLSVVTLATYVFVSVAVSAVVDAAAHRRQLAAEKGAEAFELGLINRQQTLAALELEAGNRTRTALIAAVSHDLRTPLAGIRAGVETLRRKDGYLSAADRAGLLGAVEESTDRLSTIVVDLLDMSRLQTGAVEPVLADVPLDTLVADLLAGQPDRARVTVASPLPSTRADAGLLARVLENVVVNALRHTDGPVEVSSSLEGGRVRTLVVDHGAGVPADRKPQMFEPFQRLGDAPGRDGVGLGLAVARGLLEAQGGRLSAEDTPGGGLTMVVETAAP